jgi:diadenosine tetraphosphate (Ap4A) HIT family hydrolase
VRQLHVHVVARRVDDPAWPGPVWGLGEATPYSATQRAGLQARLTAELG